MELVINTFGVTLNRDNEGFVISGNDGRQRIPAEGISSIQISRGAQISSDAVMLAVEREIEVLFNDGTGKPVARLWSPKYGSVSTMRALKNPPYIESPYVGIPLFWRAVMGRFL